MASWPTRGIAKQAITLVFEFRMSRVLIHSIWITRFDILSTVPTNSTHVPRSDHQDTPHLLFASKNLTVIFVMNLTMPKLPVTA